MPDIHLYGFKGGDANKAKGRIRHLLQDAPYAEKLTIVSGQSEVVELASDRLAPFIRVQGHKALLDEFVDDLIGRLTKDFDIEVTYNERYVPRQQ